MMIFNYLKVGLRNILKYKGFSFINVFGLAAAMSVCMLIMLMLADQRSYDQFHINKKNIYRILCDAPEFRHPYATSPFPLARKLKNESPAVREATSLVMGVGGDALYNGRTVEMRGYFADTSFFDVFSFELGKGSLDAALRAPNSMVLSAEAAHRLFNDEDPIGRTVEFSDRGLSVFSGGGESSVPVKWGIYTITGVLADKAYKSHLKFDVLVSLSSMPALINSKKMEDLGANWKNFFRCYTYALLAPGKTESDLNVSLHRIVSTTYAGFPDLKQFSMTGQRLTSISPGILLGNEPNIVLPRIVYYFLSVLAFVIMLSACLNYTNLSIARALTRAKEIGVRKVNGATRKNIVLQFLSESILMALSALIMAVLFLLLIRAAFLNLWVNQSLHFSLDGGFWVYLGFAGFALLIGLVSGIYPAFYLSGFQPLKALRNFASLRPGKLGMRKILSIVQFSVSLIFIISSILIFNQSMHFLKFDYEFNSKNIVNIDLQGNEYHVVSGELAAVAGVEKISACDYVPVTGRSEGTSVKQAESRDDFKKVTVLQTDENFVDNLQLRLIAGRNLPAGGPAGRYVLVNEAATRALGYKYPGEIIGHVLVSKWNDTIPLVVTGVLKDFHMNLDHDQIEPLLIQNQTALFKYANVRIASRDLRGTLAALERKWKLIDPIHPLRYQFFDDQLAATSQGFFDVVSILGFLAFLAVTIACLGLLGMATYTTERRLKEVGVRKVLGASHRGIVLLLSASFIRVLIWSVLIAAPLSYMLNTLWLRKFPNRVEFGIGTIGLGTLVLLALGLLTIGSQTLRAAKQDPAKVLRTE
ncbi:ABC transporter permease [Flavitalea sp. BT771]|uniref:ABC transporter permease n=1 Tax=Flavitalea sp. BT771 TaxID=3063329 RepID=UPI0026E2DE43|nr:ABC transporter permease [Flavitalea sp. BT771]MDO6431125.1 ABC transporter permease [Flavitalea sp. BT771]MDV6220032.1 ABC transporter permease [Flavitalea sp. BT771]